MLAIGSRVLYQGDLAEVVGHSYRQFVANGYFTTQAVYAIAINGRTLEVYDCEVSQIPDSCKCDLWRGCTCGVMAVERAGEETS